MNNDLTRWEFKKQMVELCAKCTQLKPSTAKKYARELFDKFATDEGCISYYSIKDYRRNAEQREDLKQALKVLKSGKIESTSIVLSLDSIVRVDFNANETVSVQTKEGDGITYSKDYKFLKYVFKTNL